MRKKAKRKPKKPKRRRRGPEPERCNIPTLAPTLPAAIRESLDNGLEPDELAWRVVRLILQIEAEKFHAMRLLPRKSDRPDEWTAARLRRHQADLEAQWGESKTRDIVRGVLRGLDKGYH